MTDELLYEIATGAIEDLLSSPTHWFLPEVKKNSKHSVSTFLLFWHHVKFEKKKKKKRIGS